MTPVKLIAFPGAPNLPFFAAEALGSFRRQGLALALETTPSSMRQAQGLVAGEFQIAGTAIDNVIAYQSGQGEVALPGRPDLFVAMGASRIELTLVVAPEIAGFADLRGRSLAMDALTTGFAFLLYAMLEEAGLPLDAVELASLGATPARLEALLAGSHAGTLLIEPYTSQALARGFRPLRRSTETFPHYQGGVFAASRGWARAHGEAMTGFCRGYLQALAWCLDPGNRTEATVLLRRHMPRIGAEQADRVMEKLLSPRTGLTPGGALDGAGVETVLELRRRYGPDAAALGPAADYIDLSYLEAARS